RRLRRRRQARDRCHVGRAVEGLSLHDGRRRALRRRPRSLTRLYPALREQEARPAPEEDVIVRLRNVDKVYSNGVVALRGLDVGEGEFLSLLGLSGCGKSTVLRLVAGLGEVSSGRIEWPSAGGRIGHASGDIGFVFQEATLMPWATVWKNVLLPLKLRGLAP